MRVLRAGGIAAGVTLIVAMLAASVVPRLTPFYRTFTVLTGSMEPAIPAGSLVVLRPARAIDLRPGDIITFTRPDQARTVVTHRVAALEVRNGTPFILTKGDANADVDPWAIPAVGEGWRVAFHIPRAGTPMIWFGHPATKLGVSVALVLMVSWLLIRRVWRGEAHEPVGAWNPPPADDRPSAAAG